GEGQCKAKLTATRLRHGGLVEHKLPAVVLDDVSAHKESQPEPGEVARLRLGSTIEVVEDALAILLGDPDTSVAHSNDSHGIRLLPEVHLDSPTVRAVARTVVHEVTQHLLDP